MKIIHGKVWVLAAIGALPACGIDFHIGNGLPQPTPQRFELAADTANDVATLTADINRLVLFSQGVESLAPSLDDFFAAAGQAATRLEKSTSPMRPASADDPCPTTEGGAIPADNICYGSETVVNPEPGVKSATLTFVLYFPNGDTSEIYGIDLYGAREFADGSTSVVLIVDQEATNGTTAANLNYHRVELQEHRYYPEGTDLIAQHGYIGINFRGTGDDDPQDRRDAVGDASDLIYYAIVQQVFADGGTIKVQFWPSEPIVKGEEPTAGAVTVETTYDSGPLHHVVETFSFDGQTATGGKTLTYDDGTAESETYTINATTANVTTAGRHGESTEVVIDLTTGTYTKVSTFGAEHPIERIDESGQIRESGIGRITVDLTSTTTFRNGSIETITATILVDQNRRVDVAYTKTSDDGTETGTLVLVVGLTSTSVEGAVVLASGIEVTVSGGVYADGFARLDVSADDPDTAADPDWSGSFRVYPDGSAEGTVTEADGTVRNVTRTTTGEVSES